MSGSYQTIITGERGLSRLPLPGHCTNYKLKYILSLSVKKKPIYLSWSFSLKGRLQASHTSAAAKSLQSCPSLCDPIDGSPPGCPVPGSLQARILEWVAISYSNACKWKVKVKSLSHVRLLSTPWTAIRQAPLSMGFSKQEYWSGVPLPSPCHTSRGYRNALRERGPGDKHLCTLPLPH